MSVWNFGGSGSWGDPTKWTGGVPDSSNAVATFSSFVVPGSNTTRLIDITQSAAPITLNRLEIFVNPGQGNFVILPFPTNTSDVELQFSSTFGEPAVIDVDTNGSTGAASIIPGSAGLTVRLLRDVNVIMRNSDTRFDISAPIAGAEGLTKFGAGTLILSNTNNSFSGGMTLVSGTVQAASDGSLGSGPLTFGGGELRFLNSTTLDNALYTAPDNDGGGFIYAATGTTLTLDMPLLAMQNPSGTLQLGSSTDRGTILLSIDSFNYAPGADLRMNGATIHLADAFNAENALRVGGTGLVELQTLAVLDTNGFFSRINNLDFDGGTLLSGIGVLDVSVVITNGESNTGTIRGTAGADSLRFKLVDETTFILNLITFLDWTDGTDSIRLIGNVGEESIVGTTQADRIDGLAGIDFLSGQGGNDIIIGGTGDDVMRGGLGDDTFFVDSTADFVEEFLDEGIDLIKTLADYVMPLNVENMSMAGGARIGTGNGLANTITGSGGADTLSGLDGNDILRGKTGADTILGGLGEDLIDGGVGKDTMTGGGDRDTYTFRDGDMNNTRNTADIITDFDQAIGEKIGLTLVDANVNLAGDQSFEFIGTNAFSNTAGELRYVQVSFNTFIEGDTNGDGQTDFMIRLNGPITLTAADMTGVQDNLPNGGAADIAAGAETVLFPILGGNLFY